MVISDFAWQKEKIEWPGEYVKVFTNLSNYPIAGYFIGAEEVRINDEHRYWTKPTFFIKPGS